MDLLPQEVKNLILSYFSLSELKKVGYPDTPSFWLAKLNHELYARSEIIKEIWDIPDSLTPRENYIKVLSYFYIIVPGSEQFIDPQICMMRAARLGDRALIKYFNKLTKENAIKVPKYGDILRKLVKGKAKPNLKKGIVPKNPTQEDFVELVYLKKWKLAEGVAEKLNMTSEEIEKILIRIYILTDNLEELDKTDLSLLVSDFYDIINCIRWAVPEISDHFFIWLNSKLNFAQKSELIIGGYVKLYYYFTQSDPKLIQVYLANLDLDAIPYIAPYILLTILPYLTPEQANQIKIAKDSSKANINLLLKYFEKVNQIVEIAY